MKPTDQRAQPELALRLCRTWGNTARVRRRVARALGVSERTLRRWAQRQRDGLPLVGRRGRRPVTAARSSRQGVIGAMLRLGPCAGVNVLRGLFRDVPYRAIASLKRRFGRVMQRRRGWYRKKLRWTQAGAVWATDFSHPEVPLEDGNDRLCLVRDLGSGAQLAAVPCRGERAAVVCAVLAALFCLLGAPLVIKYDNGGAFTAHATIALLEQHGVVALRSPPYTPQYNGACERAGGTLKRRIAHAALARGDPEHWTRGDIAAALDAANQTARPRGANGPTPAEALAARARVTGRARRAFQQTRRRAILRAVQHHKSKRGTMPSCAERAVILRRATQHALCEHGYLEFRRGRISTPFASWKAVTKA